MVGPILNAVFTGADTFTYDTFSASQNIVVTVGCRSRTFAGEELSVKGFLQENLEFGIDSKWSTIMGGSGSKLPSNLVDFVDVASQAFLGTSVRQPWFSRAIWEGNGPLKIPVTMNFLAQEDALKEVWQPIWKLVRLCLPQLQGAGLVAGINEAVGSAFNMSETQVALLKNFIGTYTIPGPSTFYPVNSEGSAPMYFQMGNLPELSLEACYFTEMKFVIPPVFDQNGHPTFASASFTVNSMDSLYIDAKGNIRNMVVTKKELNEALSAKSSGQASWFDKARSRLGAGGRI